MLIEYIELMIRHRHPEDRITRYTAYIVALFTRVVLSSTECHTVPDDPDGTRTHGSGSSGAAPLASPPSGGTRAAQPPPPAPAGFPSMRISASRRMLRTSTS